MGFLTGRNIKNNLFGDAPPAVREEPISSQATTVDTGSVPMGIDTRTVTADLDSGADLKKSGGLGAITGGGVTDSGMPEDPNLPAPGGAPVLSAAQIQARNALVRTLGRNLTAAEEVSLRNTKDPNQLKQMLMKMGAFGIDTRTVTEDLDSGADLKKSGGLGALTGGGTGEGGMPIDPNIPGAPITLTPAQIQARNAMINKLGRELTPAEEIALRNTTDPAQLKSMMEAQGVDTTPMPAPETTEEVQAAISTGDVDNFLASTFGQLGNLFAGVDLSALTQSNMDYIQQLMSGQTEATRALQAQEAAAMSRGIQNLMNNISATAANAGITGGALGDFYAKGLRQVGQMMGDFALDNIVRMADTQQQGFENFLQTIGLPLELQGKWMDTFTRWEQYKTGNKEADRAFGWNAYKYILSAAQEDPNLAVIADKVFKAISSGQPIENLLTPEEMAKMQTAVDSQWSLEDVGAEQEFWNGLGIDTVIEPVVDEQGNQKTNDAGERMWQVKPKTTINDAGELEFVESEEPTTELVDGETPGTPEIPDDPDKNYNAFIDNPTVETFGNMSDVEKRDALSDAESNFDTLEIKTSLDEQLPVGTIVAIGNPESRRVGKVVDFLTKDYDVALGKTIKIPIYRFDELDGRFWGYVLPNGKVFNSTGEINLNTAGEIDIDKYMV